MSIKQAIEALERFNETGAEQWLTLRNEALAALRSIQPASDDAVAIRNCLQDLSDAILSLGRYGFEKDATKDATAFTLWCNLNTAQAQARQTLDGTAGGVE